MQKLFISFLSICLAFLPVGRAFAQTNSSDTTGNSILTSVSTTILPNTAYCQVGSQAHPVPYCIDPTPCKIIDGKNVCLSSVSPLPAGALKAGIDCWSMQYEYSCLQFVSDCVTYTSDASCTEVGAKVCSQDSNGQAMTTDNPKLNGCTSFTHTFLCKDSQKPSSASTTQTTSCDLTSTQNGINWNVSTASAAGDFVQAATAQEFARQIAVYGTKSEGSQMNGLFPGKAMGCQVGDFGLKNCCKSEGGGAVNNHDLASKVKSQAVYEAFKYGATYAVQAGSAMVWDSIISSGQFLGSGMEAMAAAGATMDTGFGALGFGTTASSAGGVFGASGSSAIGAVGGETIYFNPYALAAAVAIHLIMNAMSCTQDEMDLANAKGKNFCHYVGSYCSKKTWLGGCMRTTQTYCCYNGLLGKAIEEGAHQQLGLSWGTPQNPNCEGLSVSQIQALDFTSPAMQDLLKPFMEEIMANFNNSVSPSFANGSVTTAAQDGAEQKSKALCLQSQKLKPSIVCN